MIEASSVPSMSGSSSPSVAAHPALARLARLFRLRGGDAPGQPLSFTVDRAVIRAEPMDRLVRLTCPLGAPPRDEAELRGLMRRFFRHADRGAETLCADAEGQLMLVADLADDGDLPRLATLFCDAAVHWSALVGGAAARPAESTAFLLDHRMQMIRP